MTGPDNNAAQQQAIREHDREWLETTARRRSNFNRVLFARQLTNLGRDRVEGMTEHEICQVLAADIAKAETSWERTSDARPSGVIPKMGLTTTVIQGRTCSRWRQ